MSTKHKHADLIHAWADGAEIQWRGESGEWCDCGDINPLWIDNGTYRIKPEPVTLYVNEYERDFGGAYKTEKEAMKALGNKKTKLWGGYIRTIKLQEVEDE